MEDSTSPKGGNLLRETQIRSPRTDELLGGMKIEKANAPRISPFKAYEQQTTKLSHGRTDSNLLDNIEKQISETLNSFEEERQHQQQELSTIKQHLRMIRSENIQKQSISNTNTTSDLMTTLIEQKVENEKALFSLNHKIDSLEQDNQHLSKEMTKVKKDIILSSPSRKSQGLIGNRILLLKRGRIFSRVYW